MSRRGLLLVSLPALSLALGAASVGFVAALPAENLPRADRLDVLDVFFSLSFVAYAAAGALIVARHPRNPVGWLLAAFGISLPVSGVLWSYAMYSLYTDGEPLPGYRVVAWGASWTTDPFLVLVILLLFLFPDGRFLTARWRSTAWAAVVAAVIWGVAVALEPGPLLNLAPIRNPFGIEGAGGVLGVVGAVAAGSQTAFFLAAGTSLVVRFRRSGFAERQQIKWLAAVGGLGVVLVAVLSTLEATAETDTGALEVITSLIALFVLSSIPAGLAIAMLRHRLYDVDLVVNRTLVYGSVTALLAAAYLGLVLLFQLAFSPVTEGNGVAVALSTLAVAGLFGPARARVQEVVDRRFYRRRYDAQRTLERFAGRLREEVDLDALRNEVTGVVARTMQPAHVSLWLRETEARP